MGSYGLHVKIGMFDSSEIDNDFSSVDADETDTPCLEAAATYATTFGTNGRVHSFASGLNEQAELVIDFGFFYLSWSLLGTQRGRQGGSLGRGRGSGSALRYPCPVIRARPSAAC